MNDRAGIDVLLRHWFADGPTTMPDRVVDVVADRIGRERQRPAWRLPWRLPVNPTYKVAAAMAAVVVVAIVGWNLLPGRDAVGPGGSPVPTQPASASPSPSPSPTPAYAWPTPLAAGQYTTRFIWDVPFELTFAVPAGWESRDIEIVQDDVAAVAFNLVDNVYSDPCRRVLRDPPLGGSVDALADALAALPGVDATTPTTVDFDRITPARYLEVSVRQDAGCASSDFALFSHPTDSYLPVGPKGPPFFAAELPNLRIWIVDIDGVRLVISALSAREATPSELAALQEVIDSIGILRPDASPPPEPAPS
jgi:hypothetical protein